MSTGIKEIIRIKNTNFPKYQEKNIQIKQRAKKTEHSFLEDHKLFCIYKDDIIEIKHSSCVCVCVCVCVYTHTYIHMGLHTHIYGLKSLIRRIRFSD